MENLDTLIDQYINGELQGQQLEAFEQRLKQEPELKKEVQLQEQLEHTLSRHFRGQQQEESLQRTLGAVSSGYFSDEKKRSRPAKVVSLRRRALLATAIAAAVAVILLVWAPWEVSLYEQYAGHPTAAFTQMSSSADNLSAAEQAFNAGDYSTAAGLLETYLQDSESTPELQYYLGICYLETEQYGKAASTFEALRAEDSAYQNEGSWYLALTYLKQDGLARCREILQGIPEGSDRYLKAQELLEAIE